MKKYSVLVFVVFMSSVLSFVSFSILDSLAPLFDTFCNSVCVWLQFSFANFYYKHICCCCDRCCDKLYYFCVFPCLSSNSNKKPVELKTAQFQ